MKEMSPEDNYRIQKEAENLSRKYSSDAMYGSGVYLGYARGAESEHERMAELLKEERIKAFSEVQDLFKTKLLPIDPIPRNIYEIAQAVSEIYSQLESLKSQ